MKVDLSACIIPVINIRTQELETIVLSEVDRYTKHKSGKFTIFHIGEDQYRSPFDNLDDIDEVLLGNGLMMTDVVNVVNMHKACTYDVELGNIYFRDSNEPASVSLSHREAVARIFEILGKGQFVNHPSERLIFSIPKRIKEKVKDKLARIQAALMDLS